MSIAAVMPYSSTAASPFAVVNGQGERGTANEAGARGQTVVFIRLNVFNVGNIDTVGGTFDADFFFTANWLEPLVDELAGDDVPSFDPQLTFMNAVGQPEYTDERRALVPWRQGAADGARVFEHRFRCNGSFREALELRDFPFDRQPLTIIVTSHHHRTTVLLKPDPDIPSKVRTEFMVLPEFRLTNVQWHEKKADDSKEDFGTYSLLHAAIVAVRKPQYYIYNVLVPILLLSLMAFAVFFFEVSELGDRLSVALTLVLTSVAFKFVVAADLPKISYNTLLDDYILGNFMFLAVIVLENVIVHYIGRHTADYDGGGEDNDAEESDESSSSSSANQVDSASWKVLAVAFAMLNLAFLVQARGRWQKNQG
jgi:hypothetical protein